MTGGTKIRVVAAQEDDYEQIEVDVASTTESQNSTLKKKKKKKKKLSEASTAASTQSNNQNAMRDADCVMSGLTGLVDHSAPGKKKKVPKKIRRKANLSEDAVDADDVISCLTDTSKSTKGSIKSSKSAKGKKKKRRSSSKKPKRAGKVGPDENALHSPESPSNATEGTEFSRSGVNRKIRHVTASRTKQDDDVSCLSETSRSSRSRKIKHIPASRTKQDDEASCVSGSSKSSRNRKKDLTKLNRRDKLYHMKNNTQSVTSMASSVTSPYHSRSFDGSEHEHQEMKRLSSPRTPKRLSSIRSRSESEERMRLDSIHSRSSVSEERKRSSSVHSRTSQSQERKRSSSIHSRTSQNQERRRSSSIHSRASTTSTKSNKYCDESGFRIKVRPDGKIKKWRPTRSESFVRKVSSFDNYGRDGSNKSDSISISSDEDGAHSIGPHSKATNNRDLRRTKSADHMKQMALASRKMKNRKVVRPRKQSSLPIKPGTNTGPAALTRTSSSRRNEPPVRIAARGDSIEVRSSSADSVRRMLNSDPSNHTMQKSKSIAYSNSNQRGRQQGNIPSARGQPIRREVNRNGSGPLRGVNRNGSGPLRGVNRNGSGPLRRTPSISRPSQPSTDRWGPGQGPKQQRPVLRNANSAVLQPPQRRAPARLNSRDMSPGDHVEILQDLNSIAGLSNHSNCSNRRSSSQPPAAVHGAARTNRQGRKAKVTTRSLSPTRDLDAKPQGILRNSSHKSDRSESNKRASRDNSLADPASRDGVPASSDLDDDEMSESVPVNFDDENYAVESEEALRDNNDIVKPDRRLGLLKRLSSQGSFLNISNHSFQSNRSQMSIDGKEYFENDPGWKKSLRYIHILPPHKHETKHEMRIRLFTWTAMFLDFIAAMVALIQYSGATKCCGTPVFDILFTIDWDLFFRVVVVMYMCMIFAEIVPVIKNGIPFNIVNPTIGFLLTIGMFFDDSIPEALAMWVIEALAIYFEFLVYRVNAVIYYETVAKLERYDREIGDLKKKQRNFVEMARPLNGSTHSGSVHSGSMSGGSIHGSSIHSGSMHDSRHGSQQGSRHGSRHGKRPNPRNVPGNNSRNNSRNRPIVDLEMGDKHSRYDDDDDSMSGHSFGGDEDFYDEENPPRRTQENRGAPKRIPPPPPRPMMQRQGSQLPNQFPRHTNRSNLTRTYSRDDILTSSTHSYGEGTIATGITGATVYAGGKFRLPGEIKQNRLLRKRRILRENKKSQAAELHYHFVGTILNVAIALVALTLVVSIASTGGLCFINNKPLNIFSRNQLGACNLCTASLIEDGDGLCEVCDNPGATQCYFKYY